MSARAAKRELAEALRGYPWERWSTRSVVWAAGMLRRFADGHDPRLDPHSPRWRRFAAVWSANRRTTSARALALARALGLDPRLAAAELLGPTQTAVAHLEAASYLWEHTGVSRGEPTST